MKFLKPLLLSNCLEMSTEGQEQTKVTSEDEKVPYDKSEHSFVRLSKSELEDLDHIKKVQEKERKNGRRLQRNLFVLAISFVFLLTAFQGMANLQSSINKEVSHWPTFID